MTQEEKDLVLQDLCARLPYGVKIHRVLYGAITLNERIIESFRKGYDDMLIPYLRPLSSMTKDEKRELQSFFPGSFGNQWLDLEEGYIDIHECESTTRLYLYDSTRLIEWLNKKMFDYRGLIDEGLAISTKEFNPYKD